MTKVPKEKVSGGRNGRPGRFPLLDSSVDALLMASRVVGRLGMVMSCVAIVGIVMLLAASALVRYIFNAPIAYTEDLSGLLFVIVFTASMAHAANQGSHFRIVLVWSRLSASLRAYAMILGDMMTVLAFAVIAKVAWEFADLSKTLNSRSDFGDLLLWPWMMIVPASIACFCFAVIVQILNTLRRLINGDLPDEEAISIK